MSTVTELTTTATLHPLVLPARADTADAAEFRELVALRNRMYREFTGRSEQDLTPEAFLAISQPTPDDLQLRWIVRDAGIMVGRAMIGMATVEGSTSAWLTVELLPEVWGRGIGGAALSFLESVAAKHGRPIWQTWAEHPPASEGERVEASTGFGSVPNDHVARFLTRRGYTLEQTERISALPLNDDTLHAATALLAEAWEHAGDYRLVTWMLPVPEEHIDGYAWMKSRMSTDVPQGGLEIDEEPWDAARVRRFETNYSDGGREMQVVAAQHIETGELCAFNELVADDSETAHQEDTLVLAGHRGHRLGMLVKCTGILNWAERRPTTTQIVTYNAEENRPMLSINEAIGFAPIGHEGVWKRMGVSTR